jgi:hypothetical protein
MHSALLLLWRASLLIGSPYLAVYNRALGTRSSLSRCNPGVPCRRREYAGCLCEEIVLVVRWLLMRGKSNRGTVDAYGRKWFSWYAGCLWEELDLVVRWMLMGGTRSRGTLDAYGRKWFSWYGGCLWEEVVLVVRWMLMGGTSSRGTVDAYGRN